MSETLYQADSVHEERIASANDSYDEFLACETARRADQIAKDIHDGLNQAQVDKSLNVILARNRLAAVNDTALTAASELRSSQLLFMWRMALQADGLGLLKYVASMAETAILETAAAEVRREYP